MGYCLNFDLSNRSSNIVLSYNALRYIICIASILFVSCSVSYNAEGDYSYLYNRQSIIAPEFKIYHSNQDTTEIIFKINSADLIYSRPSPDASYQSKFTIHYALYESLDSKFVVDSITKQIIDINPTKKDKLIYGSIKFPFEGEKSAAIKITTVDQHRNQEHKTLMIVDKTSYAGAQNFLTIEKGRSMTRPYVTSNEMIEVRSERNKGQKFVINWFENSFGISRPPFAINLSSTYEIEPNEQHEFTFDSDGKALISLPMKGFALIKQDTTDKDGLSLFRFDVNYPKVSNAKGLAEPLRYICSNSEYNGLMESENQKLAVEQFWLEKCKSKERAREIIREYYTRVNDANNYFTSHVEGWKTDRGMISIIYGKPVSIEKRSNYEIWKYGQGGSYQSPSLSFTFYKQENPFTENDFQLKRDYLYKPGWYRALDIWRAGRIYKAGA